MVRAVEPIERSSPLWLADALWISAAAAILVLVLSSAWGRALDPITDTGRDLQIPQQLRDGAKLYRDVLYYYPPLTPYLLAGITALVGTSLASYAAIGATIALLTAVAVHLVARIAGGPHAAGAATLLFVSGSVFSMSGRTANYLFPYAYATTLAMLFFLTAAGFLLQFVQKGRAPRWMALAVLGLVLASWTKIEYAGFSLLVLLVAMLAFRVSLRWLALFAVCGLVTFAAVHVYFSDAAREQHWLLENVLAPALLRGEPARHFYRQVSGFDAAASNAMAAGVGALLALAMVALVRWADRARGRWAAPVVAVVLVVSAVFGGAAFMRGWAFLQIALIPIAYRRRDPLLVLITISLCASSRIFLRLFPTWYGFVYVIPTCILITAVLFDFLPRLGLYSKKASLLWIAPIAALCAQFLSLEHQLLERKVHRVETPQGVFFEENVDRAAALNAFFEDVRARPLRSLVVMPEGLTLNYLAGIPNPLAFHTFTPVETASAGIERQIIRQMRERKPEAIAIVTRSVTDFGFRGFGVDYNRELASVIRDGYRVDRQWPSPGFELILLRRRAER
jgi:hypothetical protein